MRKVKEVLQIS